MFCKICKIVYTKHIGVYMKVLYVVDSVVDISKKIDTIKNHFGGDILYIVKANLVKIFETYGHKANAVYHNNLPTVIQTLLLKHETLTDVVYLKSSVELDKKLLNKYISAIILMLIFIIIHLFSSIAFRD